MANGIGKGVFLNSSMLLGSNQGICRWWQAVPGVQRHPLVSRSTKVSTMVSARRAPYASSRICGRSSKCTRPRTQRVRCMAKVCGSIGCSRPQMQRARQAANFGKGVNPETHISARFDAVQKPKKLEMHFQTEMPPRIVQG